MTTHIKLGEGGSGVIYRTHHYEKTYAFKVSSAVKKFQKEEINFIEAKLKEISHPNIAKIYKFKINGISIHTSIEFIDGIILADIFQLKLPVTSHRRILNSIKAGVEHYNKLKTFHGDISLNNILIQKNLVPKLIDQRIFDEEGMEVTSYCVMPRKKGDTRDRNATEAVGTRFNATPRQESDWGHIQNISDFLLQ